MASPQKEHGYTPIANEILEQICKVKLNGTQLRIIMAIWRFTYGFSRNEHEMSIGFLAKAIDADKIYTSKELAKLIDKNIISVVANPNGYHSRWLRFNKNYDEWKGSGLSDCTLSKKTTVVELDNYPIVEKDNYPIVEKDNYPIVEKDNQDKQVLKQSIKQVYRAFFESIWNLYPNKKGKSKVNKESIEELYELGFEKVRECIERYKAEKPDWQQWQHGSTFFNGGYLDYLKCDDVKVEIKQIECEKPQVDLTEDEIDALMEKEYALLTEDEKKLKEQLLKM